MWEDFKRLVAVLMSHAREQRELFIYKLIMANYSGARDASNRRLGEYYYKAYKEGRITEVFDEGIAAELDSLLRIDDEIERTAREIDILRADSFSERDSLFGGAAARPAKTPPAAPPPAPPAGNVPPHGAKEP